MVKGGMVLDFLVLTKPLATPLLINGDYWHQDSGHERFYEAMVSNYFQQRANLLVTLWGEDCDTIEHAIGAVRREFRV